MDMSLVGITEGAVETRRVERFKCPYCGYKVRNFEELKRHCRLKHSHQCPVCGKQSGVLSIHLAVQRDKDHMVAYGLLHQKRKYGTRWFRKCKKLGYQETKIL